MAWEDEIITGNNQPELELSDQDIEKEYDSLKEFMKGQGLDLEKDGDLEKLQQIRGDGAVSVERGRDRKEFLRNLMEGVHSGNIFFRKEGETAPSQIQRKDGRYSASEPLDKVQPPKAMGSMKKPNIFIRVLNAVFGVFQKRMDEYNAQKIPKKPNIFIRKLNQWFEFFKKRMDKYNKAAERYRVNTNTMSRYENLKKIFLTDKKRMAEKVAQRAPEMEKKAPEAVKAETQPQMEKKEPETVKTEPEPEKKDPEAVAAEPQQEKKIPEAEENASLRQQVKELQEQMKTMQEQIRTMQEQMNGPQQAPMQENRMTGYRRQQPQREEYIAPVDKRAPKKDRTETTAGLSDTKQQLKEIEQMQQAMDGISPDALKNTLIVAAMADDGGDLENVFDYAKGISSNPERAKKALETSGQRVEAILQGNDRDGMARMLANGLRNTLELYENNKLMNSNAVIQGRCCQNILNIFRDNPEFAQIAAEKYGLTEELQTLARGAAYGAELYGKGLQAKEQLTRAAGQSGKWIDNIGGPEEAKQLSLQVMSMEAVQTDRLSHYLRNRENPQNSQGPTEFQKYLGRSESREHMEQKLSEKLQQRMGDDRILTTLSNRELMDSLKNPNPTRGLSHAVGERKTAMEKRKNQLGAAPRRKQIAAPEMKPQAGGMSAGR